MKNHKKVFVLFMFLFIYFVIPGNVFAVQQVCSCNGEGFSGELNIGAEEYSGAVNKTEFIFANNTAPDGWSQSSIGHRPLTNDIGTLGNENNFNPIIPSGTNGGFSIQCPSSIILEKSGNLYLYGDNQSTEASAFRNSSSMEKYSVLMSCTIENAQNSSVPDNSKIENTQQQIEETTQANDREQKRKRREQILIKKKENNGVDVSKQNKQDCSGVFGSTSDENSVAWILQKLFNYIRIFGILLTVVLSAFDYTKAVISSDYDALKKAQKRQSFRTIGVVALLILPVLINFLLGLFISGTVTDFSCGIY